ncbi:MAG: type IX secretion system membrane protein PorP/SprF [Cyclobacteriaceae bacterium]|nr:type IX secretion system membrane protein PorP/SprF [Cyclobacteriaceae bacterium]
MKYFTLLLLVTVCSLPAFAQQDPLYAQYINNPILLNPAYAGLNNNFNANATYRNQWGGFDGNPVTFNFNTHVSLVNNKVGAGLLISQDKLGIIKNTEVQAAFSYKLPLDNDRIFSFGMQAGFVNFRANYNDLNIPDDQRDDIAFSANENLSKPSLGAGFILKSEKYLLGASVPRLLSTTVTASSTGQEFELYKQHFYFFGSYIIFLNENVRFKPSALVRAVGGSPLSVDLNFNFNINEKFTVGAFTRNFGAYGIQLQAKLGDNFRFGYIFELPTNNSVGTRFTTHEVLIGATMPVFDYHDRSISSF